jgi:hypothetical protein
LSVLKARAQRRNVHAHQRRLERIEHDAISAVPDCMNVLVGGAQVRPGNNNYNLKQRRERRRVTYDLPPIAQEAGNEFEQDFGREAHESVCAGVIRVGFVQLHGD